MDLSPAPAPPLVPKNPSYMETDPSRETAEKPKEQTFESNANSMAASKLPASGEAPLPSQEGKDRPFLQMDTQKYALPTKGAEPQPKVESTPAPTPPPLATATPPPKASEPPKATPSPAPTASPPPTPEPEKFAMLTATPPPPLSSPQEVEATPTPSPPLDSQLAMLRPQPAAAASSYQPEREQTRIAGKITNRGRSSVNAVGTPLGRYQKAVHDAIGARWYFYVEQKRDLATIGTAFVEAEVDAEGHVTNLRLRSNSSSETFANICLQSFQEARIPPIPPDLIPALPNGRLTVEINFTIFANE